MAERPLRPELYDRLQHLFRHVLIANEGEEMVSRPSLSSDGSVHLSITSPGEYYRVNCPFCYDTRKRLWINHRWGFFDPRTQTRNLWLAICYNQSCLNSYDRQIALYRDVFSEVGDGTDVVLAGTKPTAASREVVWPGKLTPIHLLSDTFSAICYLRDRGFDPKQLGRDLRVSYCFDADYEFRVATNRIIIPIRMNGQNVGWQARFVGTPPNKETPKYYTMPGFKKTQYLYNLDRARQYPFVVICEGVTDVWRVGPTSVALFGKTLSTTQRLLLGTYWGQGAAVVLLDSDAQDNAQGVYDSLRDVVARRVLVRLPEGKDPGDLDRGQLDQLILEAGREQGVDLAAMLKREPATPQDGVEASVKTESTNQMESSEAASAQ